MPIRADDEDPPTAVDAMRWFPPPEQLEFTPPLDGAATDGPETPAGATVPAADSDDG